MLKYIIETFSKVDEQAKITGIAAIPRISRNNRLYLKSELAKADGLRVPLNWEHTDKIVGYVTYHYNPELEQLYYEGIIEDEATATLAKNKMLFTSIEAEPREVKKQCFTAQDCMEIPIGLERWQLALTEMPGIPETSVRVIESVKEDCVSDCIKAKKDSGKEIDDQAVAICHSECGNKEMNYSDDCPSGQHKVDGKCIDMEERISKLEKIFSEIYCQKHKRLKR